jgi:DNA polymerase-3 subunit delta'
MSPRAAASADDLPPDSDALDGALHPRANTALFGHEAAEAEFLEAFRQGRMPQAWLIGGREGIGKATFAWRAARFVLARPDPRLPAVARAHDLFTSEEEPAARRIVARAHPDVACLRREWDAKTKKHYTEIRVDDVRKTLGMFHHAAGAGGWRVAVVDSADDLNTAGANALLKMIEEPPPRSLFFIIAHRPARVLPTIRSRCRRLTLHPLTAEAAAQAIRAQGEDWADHAQDDLLRAAQRAGGSVGDAMRLLAQGALGMAERTEAELARLPDMNVRRVMALADASYGRDGQEAFETLLAGVFDWLGRSVRERAQEPGAVQRLAPLAQVWEKIAASARETQALNLDRRPLVLSIFSDLSDAVRASRM